MIAFVFVDRDESRAVEWMERAAPRRGFLTNMHIDLDYETIVAETPDHIMPAYDGMTLTFRAA